MAGLGAGAVEAARFVAIIVGPAVGHGRVASIVIEGVSACELLAGGTGRGWHTHGFRVFVCEGLVVGILILSSI